jgi:nitrite reductase/ring-hydroxylating ferredoxin subunit/uncharacterized membrane protein
MSLKNILQGRPFGHPLHPLIIHLPLGMWLFALLLDIAGAATHDSWTLVPSLVCLLVGSAVAVLAVITGLTDFWGMRADHPGQRAAVWHMCLMLPATLLFLLDTLDHYAALHRPSLQPLGLVLSAIAYTLTLIGGYLGGRLVYQDGISVGRHRRTLPLPRNTLVAPPQTAAPEETLAPASAAPEPALPADFHPLCPESALPEGGTLRATCEGTVVTLARSNGQIYSVQEFCTHRCGPLSEGSVCDNQITCPWHRSTFDLRTGKPTHGPAKVDLKTFEVQIHHGIVHLRITPQPTEPPRPDTRPSPRRNPTDSTPTPEPSPRPASSQSPIPRTPRDY